MIKLACFPKCFMDELCVHRTMTVFDWIRMASELDIEGLELYPGFLQSLEPGYLERVRRAAEDVGLELPMFCASPDFTVPDARLRRQEVEKFELMIDVTVMLGGKSIRTLTGQRYPEVSREQGLRWVVESLTELADYAEKKGVVMALENHYKDNYWTYPEFAQNLELFLEVLDRVPSPWLKVNFDASNPIIAGEDPILVLESVKERLITMHASDRYIRDGKLVHGVIGGGMVNYDEIFRILRQIGFDGWISIEDGVNGLEEIKESILFLRRMIAASGP